MIRPLLVAHRCHFFEHSAASERAREQPRSRTNHIAHRRARKVGGKEVQIRALYGLKKVIAAPGGQIATHFNFHLMPLPISGGSDTPDRPLDHRLVRFREHGE